MSDPTLNPAVQHLTDMGFPADAIEKVVAMGATSVEDLKGLTEVDLTGAGVPLLKARTLLRSFAPAAVTASAPVVPGTSVDPNAEIPEGKSPTSGHVTSFASSLGLDPSLLLMMLGGNGGGDFNLGDMMPIPTLVNGYNPKRRDLFLIFMGKVQQRYEGIPLIVINADGSINRELTIEYIEGLEEGRDPMENDIYHNTEGVPHQILRVGVDAQSVEDSDPLNPAKALQKSGMGIGRVNWNGVNLDVRQVAYYAVASKEIDPSSKDDQDWLRDHVKKGVNRLVFAGKCPQALSSYNEAARTGSLPTLRVMLASSPRRENVFPRRRTTTPRALPGTRPETDENGNPVKW